MMTDTSLVPEHIRAVYSVAKLKDAALAPPPSHVGMRHGNTHTKHLKPRPKSSPTMTLAQSRWLDEQNPQFEIIVEGRNYAERGVLSPNASYFGGEYLVLQHGYVRVGVLQPPPPLVTQPAPAPRRRSPGETTRIVLEAFHAHPTANATEIGKICGGIWKTQVCQILRAHGLTTAFRLPRPLSTEERRARDTQLERQRIQRIDVDPIAREARLKRRRQRAAARKAAQQKRVSRRMQQRSNALRDESSERGKGQPGFRPSVG
jgi:hypothetical protein